MHAAVVTRAGGPEVLEYREQEDPEPAADEVLVRVRAATINPTDLGAREGRGPGGATPPYVLGWDLAGEVVAHGDRVRGGLAPAVGARVAGLIPWYADGGRRGAYAELVAVPVAWLVPIPDELDDVVAATLPLNALTARQFLDELDPPASGSLLVTGASGAVGAFAVQFAVERGLDVTAVAGGGDEDFVRGLGARTVLPRDVDYASVGSFTHVVDAVPVGSAVLPAVADGGRILGTRPPDGEPVRGIRWDVQLVRAELDPLPGIVDAVARGALVSRVDRTLPLAQAAEGHRVVEQDHPRGKVVLLP
jgi:NADPH:quinone reductase